MILEPMTEQRQKERSSPFYEAKLPNRHVNSRAQVELIQYSVAIAVLCTVCLPFHQQHVYHTCMYRVQSTLRCKARMTAMPCLPTVSSGFIRPVKWRCERVSRRTKVGERTTSVVERYALEDILWQSRLGHRRAGRTAVKIRQRQIGRLGALYLWCGRGRPRRRRRRVSSRRIRPVLKAQRRRLGLNDAVRR